MKILSIVRLSPLTLDQPPRFTRVEEAFLAFARSRQWAIDLAILKSEILAADAYSDEIERKLAEIKTRPDKARIDELLCEGLFWARQNIRDRRHTGQYPREI